MKKKMYYLKIMSEMKIKKDFCSTNKIILWSWNLDLNYNNLAKIREIKLSIGAGVHRIDKV